MLVMQYASEGDLHNYLKRQFTQITWNKEKLRILWQISEGYLYLITLYYIYEVLINISYFRLETIHKANFIHRDFHSGNILFNLYSKKRHQWQIGDLGLSQPANNISNNGIYGVINTLYLARNI